METIGPPDKPLINKAGESEVHEGHATTSNALFHLTEEDARDAVQQFSSEKCCYGNKLAQEMHMLDINMKYVFSYQLETLAEKRLVAQRFETYNGGGIDGPNNGVVPFAWDVFAPQPVDFKPSSYTIKIPHSSVLKQCTSCFGSGNVNCLSCAGSGQITCNNCGGRGVIGTQKYDMCSSCGGRGSRPNYSGGYDDHCYSCGGSGSITRYIDEACGVCYRSGHVICYSCNSGLVCCTTCIGNGSVVHFDELTVKWTKHTDDYISMQQIPKKLIEKVACKVIFNEENQTVLPLTHGAEQSVYDASAELIGKHKGSVPDGRIVKQRHALSTIPLAECHYNWKNKDRLFFIYGFEQRVYFEDYPDKCCCCCTIL